MKSNANNDRPLYLLTGAAGFLGSHICEELLDRGDRVRALVLRGDPSIKYIPRNGRFHGEKGEKIRRKTSDDAFLGLQP